MTIGELLTKLWNGVLALFGKESAETPETPAQSGKTEVQMAFEKVQAAVQELEDAISRASANAQAAATQAANDASTISGLNTELADAEDQIVQLLQPALDQANALAPAPAATDPTTTTGA